MNEATRSAPSSPSPSTSANPSPRIVPHLVLRGAAEAIEFYKRAFGFEEAGRLNAPDGKVLHCELRLGGWPLMLADEFPMAGCRSPAALGGSSVTIHLDVPDVDAAFARATAAGAKVTMPPADMFWGARYGQLADPFGHHWSLSTHKEDVPFEEMKRRAAALFADRPG